VDIEVTYAYAPGDNEVGPGSVLFEDIPQQAEVLFFSLPGLNGDTGSFEIVLVATPCAIPASSAVYSAVSSAG